MSPKYLSLVLPPTTLLPVPPWNEPDWLLGRDPENEFPDSSVPTVNPSLPT